RFRIVLDRFRTFFLVGIIIVVVFVSVTVFAIFCFPGGSHTSEPTETIENKSTEPVEGRLNAGSEI
ncbi:MAG: hypothetical protein VXY93_20650, partial [Pseudomonadota bacterium]|nr:hypothetical protein [Pseudomonadota bacterium]